MRLRAYVAGPYTSDPTRNVRAAVQAADLLLSRGYAPYVPHLTHLWQLIAPRPYEDWLALDLEWLRAADLVVRLDGDSQGADREVAQASRLGIPVVCLEDAMMGVIRLKTTEPPARTGGPQPRGGDGQA